MQKKKDELTAKKQMKLDAKEKKELEKYTKNFLKLFPASEFTRMKVKPSISIQSPLKHDIPPKLASPTKPEQLLPPPASPAKRIRKQVKKRPYIPEEAAEGKDEAIDMYSRSGRPLKRSMKARVHE